MNAAEINQALKDYRVNNTFCILAITNVDLYPSEEGNFVFGLADMSSSCGVFSFSPSRHAAMNAEMNVAGLSREEMTNILMKRSSGNMVHEIVHMFGLRHCVYYECTMNGANGPFEGDRAPNRTLCPVCLCKLKCNAKFDCRERFVELIRVSQEQGFHVQA